MLNEIFNDKIMTPVNLILQGDVKTIISVFTMIFIMILVMTIYMDINNILKEVSYTLQSESFEIATKYMLLPLISLICLFLENYPIEIMNNYSIFIRIVCFIWSLLLLKYIYVGFIYIFSTKKEKTPKVPKIKVDRNNNRRFSK